MPLCSIAHVSAMTYARLPELAHSLGPAYMGAYN